MELKVNYLQISYMTLVGVYEMHGFMSVPINVM